MEWHNILDPNSPELDRLAERYRLHPLHIEDCRHRNQSAKIEEGEDYIFTVVKGVRFSGYCAIDTADLDIFLGADYVITVVEDNFPELQSLVEQVRKTVSGTLRADQLYYRIIDRIVDAYLPVLDRFDDTIEEIDDQALNAPTPQTLSRIFAAKRGLIVMRRVLVNSRDVARLLQRTESPFISRDMWPFLRDVYDHVARNLDTVDMQRDLLNGALDVYLSSVANRTNQVMKVLTVLGTAALPSLVITGMYGMNVKGLPGAESSHALAVVVAMVVALTALLLWVLKRFDWF